MNDLGELISDSIFGRLFLRTDNYFNSQADSLNQWTFGFIYVKVNEYVYNLVIWWGVGLDGFQSPV